jgi:hypothetical protein
MKETGLSVDIESVLEWMDYQETYQGVSEAKKAAHWDSLKGMLAAQMGVEQPQVLVLKYPKQGLKGQEQPPKRSQPPQRAEQPEPADDEGEGESQEEDYDEELDDDLPEPPMPPARKRR